MTPVRQVPVSGARPGARMGAAVADAMLRRIPAARVGVVGDVCLDEYWELDARTSEVSVETGLATRPVRSRRSAPGGAGNVAANLKALGVGGVSVFGVVGPDPPGRRVRELLESRSIRVDGLFEQERNWTTHTYVKPVERGIEGNRYDFGNFNRLSAATARGLADALAAALPGLDVLVVNQQVPSGIHASGLFRSRLREIIRSHRAGCVLLDSRRMSGRYAGTIRKINVREAVALGGGPRAGDPGPAEGRAAASALSTAWGQPVFVTLGDRGCLVASGGRVEDVPGLRVPGKVDPVGAGDSMLAGIAAVLAVGGSPADAAAFGALVAGVTVRKIGETGTASPGEIRRAARAAAAQRGRSA